MNSLYLNFDLSDTDMADSGTDDFRHELSVLIDQALKKTGQGHWTANRIKDNLLQVKCSVYDPAQACAQIKQLLSNHWIINHLLPGN